MNEDIIVNGFVVKNGITKWVNEWCYIAAPGNIKYFGYCIPSQMPDSAHMERGLVYTTAEDAIARAKAMLGIDPYN